MPPKTRVATMLKDAIVRKSPNKSEDLDALVVRYHALQKKIRHLLSHLKAEHSTMVKYYNARAKVALQMELLTAGTPLFETSGSDEASGVEKQVGAYGSMHEDAAIKAHSRADVFQERIIDYVAEWDSVVTSRVDAGIKKSIAFRRDLDHYENKVESLKSKKTPDDEKIDRNAGKLLGARGTYENHLADMCILLEEVTEKSWKDLIPLLARMAAWDKQSTDEESICMSKMNDVIEKLSSVPTEYDMEGYSNDGGSSRFVKLANDEPIATISSQTHVVGDHAVMASAPVVTDDNNAMKASVPIATSDDDDDDVDCPVKASAPLDDDIDDDVSEYSDDDIYVGNDSSRLLRYPDSDPTASLPPQKAPVSDDVNAVEFIDTPIAPDDEEDDDDCIVHDRKQFLISKRMSGRMCSVSTY